MRLASSQLENHQTMTNDWTEPPLRSFVRSTSLVQGIANRMEELAQKWYPQDAVTQRALDARIRSLHQDYADRELSKYEVEEKKQRLKAIENDLDIFNGQHYAHVRTVWNTTLPVLMYATGELAVHIPVNLAAVHYVRKVEKKR
jgi:hypothetical protein